MLPRGAYVAEEHFGRHRPACAGHCLLARLQEPKHRDDRSNVWPADLKPAVMPLGCWPSGCKNMLTVTLLMVTVPVGVWMSYVEPLVAADGSLLPLLTVLLLLASTLGFLLTAWLVEPVRSPDPPPPNPGAKPAANLRPHSALTLRCVAVQGVMHVDSRGSGRDAVWFIVDRYTKKEHELVEFRAKFCRETVRNPSAPLSPSRFPPACSSRPPPSS
eukprot:COSAG04_NODE_2425_length_4143_cov_810.029674_4_plen_216_part_00